MLSYQYTTIPCQSIICDTPHFPPFFSPPFFFPPPFSLGNTLNVYPSNTLPPRTLQTPSHHIPSSSLPQICSSLPSIQAFDRSKQHHVTSTSSGNTLLHHTFATLFLQHTLTTHYCNTPLQHYPLRHIRSTRNLLSYAYPTNYTV